MMRPKQIGILVVLILTGIFFAVLGLSVSPDGVQDSLASPTDITASSSDSEMVAATLIDSHTTKERASSGVQEVIVAPQQQEVVTRTAPTVPVSHEEVQQASTSTSPIVPHVPEITKWKQAITTVFWVGESESSDNNYIHNRASAWDEDWVGTFGGADDPDDRCGYRPCAFTPKQNPFYVALPYLEYTRNDYKQSARDIPWWTAESMRNDTLLNGHWVAVRVGERVCYGQWRDVGPYETDDFAYVFGTATTPRNTFDTHAGLDVSPALRDCLGMDDVAYTSWGFVPDDEVPDGPWRK